jgi:hypothetical protein
MSNFSEICPIFNTGVFGQVTFPRIDSLTGISTTANFLEGTITAGTGAGQFSFGRTVVVTGAFIRRYGTNTAAENIYLQHRTSAGAAATAFGTATVTTTLSIYTIHTYWPMTVANTTFTSSEVLSMGDLTVTATAIGAYDLIVRYKEA